MTTIYIGSDVAEGIKHGRPLVALETAVLTCGLPRAPWDSSHGPCPADIDDTAALHLATCNAMAKAVRDAGAVPAVCGVLDGQPWIGLDDDQCAALAEAPPAKAAADSIALHIARGSSAGTTVGGTLQLIQAAAKDGIRIRWFATGGIGGVHRNWQDRPDVSSDLLLLSRVPCAVVCAGAKSILDTHATAEALQTLGVPLLGLGCGTLPAFLSPGGPDAPAIEDASDDVASILHSHWALGGGGVVLAQDPPASTAMDLNTATALAEETERSIDATGPLRTPALLGDMAQRSNGASLRANIALLLHNASTASRLAQHGESTATAH